MFFTSDWIDFVCLFCNNMTRTCSWNCLGVFSPEYKTTAPELQNKLYRYYIDSSAGQSGSPVYVERKIRGKTKYFVLGIHVGGWTLTVSQGKSCNVCMRLDAALEQMKAEGWPEWAREQGSKADEESAALGVQGQLLP